MTPRLPSLVTGGRGHHQPQQRIQVEDEVVFFISTGGKPETTQGEGSEGEEEIDKGGTIVAVTLGCWWRET